MPGTENNNDLSTVIWERLDPGRTRNPLAVMKYRRDDGWNDAPPLRKPGDRYILSGVTAGAVIGGVLGFSWGFFALFLGVIAGGTVGAIAGSFVLSRRERAVSGRRPRTGNDHLSVARTNTQTVRAEVDPFRGAREEHTLLKIEGEDGWGDMPPKRKSGDVWIIVVSIAGMVVGGILGYVVNPVASIAGIILGGVAGATAGSIVRGIARKRRMTRALREHRSSRSQDCDQ
jgi:outer membrane lipoprotein SlyB